MNEEPIKAVTIATMHRSLSFCDFAAIEVVSVVGGSVTASCTVGSMVGLSVGLVAGDGCVVPPPPSLPMVGGSVTASCVVGSMVGLSVGLGAGDCVLSVGLVVGDGCVVPPPPSLHNSQHAPEKGSHVKLHDLEQQHSGSPQDSPPGVQLLPGQ